MNPDWRSFLESAEAVFDGDSDEILNFGDTAGELEAARSRTILVPLTHLGLIEVAGEDARVFLHNQFTSDINHLASAQAPAFRLVHGQGKDAGELSRLAGR